MTVENVIVGLLLLSLVGLCASGLLIAFLNVWKDCRK